MKTRSLITTVGHFLHNNLRSCIFSICFPVQEIMEHSCWCTSGRQSSGSFALICRIGSIIINSLHTQTASSHWRVSQPTWVTHFSCCSLYTTWYDLIIKMHEIGGLQYKKKLAPSSGINRFLPIFASASSNPARFWMILDTRPNINSNQGGLAILHIPKSQ